MLLFDDLMKHVVFSIKYRPRRQKLNYFIMFQLNSNDILI